MTQSRTLRGIAEMNVAVALLAVNDAAMKLALATLPLGEAMAIRGAVSACLILALARGATRLRVARADWPVLAVRTLAEVTASCTFLIALSHMRLAHLSAIQQALPLVMALCAALAFGERPGRDRTLLMALGFTGVLVILRPWADGFDGWSVFAIAAMLATLVRDLATRRLSSGVQPFGVMLAATLGVTALGLAWSADEAWRMPDAGEAGLLLLAAVMLPAGAYLTAVALRRGVLALVEPVRYAGLVWAMALGWAIFGSLPDAKTLAGAGVVVAAGLATCWHEARAVRRARQGPAKARGGRLRPRLRRAPGAVDNPHATPYTPVTRAQAPGFSD